MTPAKASLIAATLLMLGTIAGAHAQNAGSSNNSTNNGTNVGGTSSSGTGVKTGQGPLTRPIPPATSMANPRQDPQRPLNAQGPAQTTPAKQPFGSQ